jgi:uncharacterized protein YecE (DUF72 family)
MKSFHNNFYAGTSGIVLPVPKSLYPAAFIGKSRLTYYASLFNSIEINSSFYKLPRASTVMTWAESVPANFRFTFKLSKAITHVRNLDFNPAEVQSFMETVAHVGNKKGCLLAQFPPALKIDKLNRLMDLVSSMLHFNKDNEWQIAIEFRDNSWYVEEAYKVLNDYNITMVIHDLPKSATPLDIELNSARYLRFHGPGGRYRGSYSNEFLAEYAQYIRAWLQDGKIVYVYFNNTMGDAVKNLQELKELVQ